MSAADLARARAFFCVYAVLDVLTIFIVVGLLLLALAPLAADGSLQGTALVHSLRALSSAGKRVVALWLGGMIAATLTERCEWPSERKAWGRLFSRVPCLRLD